MVGDLSHHNMIFMFFGRKILVTKSVINVFLHDVEKCKRNLMFFCCIFSFISHVKKKPTNQHLMNKYLIILYVWEKVLLRLHMDD